LKVSGTRTGGDGFTANRERAGPVVGTVQSGGRRWLWTIRAWRIVSIKSWQNADKTMQNQLVDS
jgi:hypothetical protein